MGTLVFRLLLFAVLVAALADLVLLGLVLYRIWKFLM